VTLISTCFVAAILYLTPLLDDSQPAIRRVEYDVDIELEAFDGCGLPHADWVAKILRSGCFQMP
jgi:hypothetical protein